ncbi:hypothetical protein DVH26_07705 [Paenibacillus sp. H1-7]|uniref:hypothetical protein n=1 Tax=Paenibacillus sp. H1-7 TaxID=2282849 RepID=UPI001EF8F57F|nr:hypothetical protein [Paenibacillus sp. H1-7]ULL14343.1 hypothetical protein DVH26_07705 [Paenibacillus sp. H1-7]
MRVYFEGKTPRQHTPVTKSDLYESGKPVNSEPVVSKWSKEEIDRYFKTKYPNLKPPRNSEGQKLKRPILGAKTDKESQKRRKGAM